MWLVGLKQNDVAHERDGGPKESEKVHEMCPMQYPKGCQVHQSSLEKKITKKRVKFTGNWFGYLLLTCKVLGKWCKAKILALAKEVGFSGQ